jgi:hypothetical protein
VRWLRRLGKPTGTGDRLDVDRGHREFAVDRYVAVYRNVGCTATEHRATDLR